MKKRASFVVKGIVSLIVLKISIFCIFLVISSCSKEKSKDLELTEQQKIALASFGKTLKDQRKDFIDFFKRHETEILELKNREETHINAPQTTISIEDSLAFILSPSTKRAKDIIIAFGATEQDIIDSLGSLTDDRQITAAMSILSRYENAVDPGLVKAAVFQSLFINSASAKPKWVECLIEALGINVFNSVQSLFADGVAQGVKKVLGEVAKRYFGPAGIACVLFSYAWCMW
jgi:hypothetical protein